ncbi:MAG: D-tyrosyl-tRNA(Tyr) deacylase [Actinobacteria bacterium]|nr:D-tyrosyl-tRNA(Tyr) deacylase [Actinomycetota bacterium]
MKTVVQRVSRASVEVDGEIVGAIDAGLLVLVGVARSDSEADAQAIAAKIAGLRIFADDAGHMNLSVKDVGGSVLVVSQFTLYGDAVKGRRPSFTAAASGDRAEPLVEAVARSIEAEGVRVARGKFGAKMSVALVNDGPVTIILETKDGRVV